MNRSKLILPILTAAGILGIASQSALAQNIVFSDNFGNGSTVQAAPAQPTANSTSYEFFQQGANPGGFAIAPGDLRMQGRTTSSVLTEMEARFTQSPITLANIGDSLNFTVTFVNTSNIFPNTTASTLNIGLFNSHGSLPVQGVRLDTSTVSSGGAIGWTGYVGRIGGTGSGAANSAIYTRPAQGPSNNSNQEQDALFNGASGSGSYTNPTGMLVATTGGQFAGMTQGNSYTLSYTITLSAAGTLTINNNLYDSSDLINALISQTGTTSTGLETTFDSLAFGWRYNGGTTPGALPSVADISSITVSDNIGAVPEPSIFALAGLGAVGLMRRFRRKG